MSALPSRTDVVAASRIRPLCATPYRIPPPTNAPDLASLLTWPAGRIPPSIPFIFRDLDLWEKSVGHTTDVARHAPRASLGWNADAAQKAIDDIVQDACAASDAMRFWPAHPQDDGVED